MQMIELPAKMDTKIADADNMIRQIDPRSRESFAHAREVVRAWGGLEPILAWCRTELIGDWRWQLVDMSSDQRPGRYIFYFDSERDCCAFALKWC
jgi:hypothetical protein